MGLYEFAGEGQLVTDDENDYFVAGAILLGISQAIQEAAFGPIPPGVGPTYVDPATRYRVRIRVEAEAVEPAPPA